MVNIPPITLDIVALAQSNILQSLLSVFVASMVGCSGKDWVHKFGVSLASIPFAFIVVGVIMEFVAINNWRYLFASFLIALGSWIMSKGNIPVKK